MRTAPPLISDSGHDDGARSDSVYDDGAPDGARSSSVHADGARYAGWATVAYPELSADAMQAILARQVDAGANVVWLGHNNPGEVDASIAEPGLSYAVYGALRDPQDPHRADAEAIVAAQLRMLGAAQALGLKVVLPVGYQLQMGTSWDAAHPDDLRRDSGGNVSLETSVPNASLYSPALRADLQEYYAWVDATFVRPYRATILMLNLADEPAGGDYSPWADAEFLHRNGYAFAAVANDAGRQEALGRFQSAYIAEYASWAASQWAELEPGLLTTMSFCGGLARIHLQLPEVERLFADTPANFLPTFDAYPRDGPPDAAIDDATLVQLFTLVRSLGHYSARYAKPFWLWSTANSWGLGQASADPANVADAVANGYYLALLARQTGGQLAGIAVWNYNARGQGLYQDTHATTYEPEAMFARISESFPRIRELLAAPSGRSRVLVWAPNRRAYQALGASRASNPWQLRSYNFELLLALARNNVPAAVVSDLMAEDLTAIRSILILARTVEEISEIERERIRAFTAQGGVVVAAEALRDILGDGATYVSVDRVEAAFTDSPSNQEILLWERALGVVQPIQAYRVRSGSTALLYSIRPAPSLLQVPLAYVDEGFVASANGAPLRLLQPNTERDSVLLGPHQYAYLTGRGPRD